VLGGVGHSRQESFVYVDLNRATWRYAPHEVFARLSHVDDVTLAAGGGTRTSVKSAAIFIKKEIHLEW
jgi:hypothetical protein